MKHVFVINSHTTFLTALGTVEYLGLKAEDVILVYTRNYANNVTPVPFKVVEGTGIADDCRNIGADYEGYIRKVDAFIEQNIQSRYSLYVPHLWHYFFQLLYTNKACRKVSYVQEGGPVQTGVYDNDVPLKERVKSFIRHAILGKRTFECKWYKRGTLYKQLTIDSYAINDVYFRCLPSRNHIVKWPMQELDISIKKGWPIFIFDGHTANGLVEPDVYLRSCKDIIMQYAASDNYVKFHPAQNREERQALMAFFSELGCHVETMSDDIPVEYIILQFKNLTFVGFTSSLLYYAHDFGHEVVCCEKLLAESSETYRKHVATCGFQTYAQTYGQ